MRKFLMTKAAGLAAPPVPERPRSPRIGIEIVGTVRVADQRLPARIFDLSCHGLGARSVRPLPIGSPIVVSLPVVGDVRAQVRWALGEMFGARFIDPVDLQPLLAAPAPAPESPAVSEA